MPSLAKPLSNAEVYQICRQFQARQSAGDDPLFAMSTEQGNELRRHTMGYIDTFNEFEQNDQIMEVRR